ncbi:MAG: prepilin-type N-terminal cleavage/methylation domain-containing protein [Candidatus Omnitrophota bacterium]
MLKKNGTTLIEVMISALILAITIAGLFASFSTAQSLVSHAGRLIPAKDFAQQTLETLRKEVRDDSWNTGELRVQETSWEPLPGTFGTIYSGQRKYAVENSPFPVDGSGGRKVTVTVDWQEP